MLNVIEIANWLQDHCAANYKLVGVGNDNEVFIETEDMNYIEIKDDTEKDNFVLSLRQKFPSIGKITFVVKPSLKQVHSMINDLNVFLKNQPVKKDLLDIEKF